MLAGHEVDRVGFQLPEDLRRRVELPGPGQVRNVAGVKCVVPGLRLGWITAPEDLMEKLITVKQATDLHTSHFTQSILHRYLVDNDLDAHVRLAPGPITLDVGCRSGFISILFQSD